MATRNKYPRKYRQPDAAAVSIYAWYGALVGIVIVLMIVLVQSVK